MNLEAASANTAYFVAMLELGEMVTLQKQPLGRESMDIFRKRDMPLKITFSFFGVLVLVLST